MLKVTPLASGSKGNCTWIENDQAAYVVDCGLSCKALLKRTEDAGLNIAKLQGILVTHEHTDHSSGLRVTSNKLDIPVYCNANTAGVLRQKNRLGEKTVIFENGSTFFLNGIEITPFTIPHDAVDTVAYTLSYNNYKVAIATDFGFPSELMKAQLKACDSLVLECNYDQATLMATGRPWRLIQRIMSRHGHLSNEQSMDLLSHIMHDGLKELFIGHISEEANNYDLVQATVDKTLATLGRSDLKAQVLRRFGLALA